jgi:hypothetical protein
MPQPLPALYQTEVAYHAIMAAAHASQTRIPEPNHGTTGCTGAAPCQILTRRESKVTAIRSISPRDAKCSASDSILFAKNESESEKSARARP